jgi:transcriptional regulator with XRE-family HTH domain
MATNEFRQNLRYLCNLYKSVADVCRRIDINRQQFNKYLGGQSEPSNHNLRKICDFFGVGESELYGPHENLVALFAAKPVAIPELSASLPQSNIFPTNTDAASKYLGYYFVYIVSPSFPGHIVKSITRIMRDGEQFVTKTYERMAIRDSDDNYYSINKYRGFCFTSADLLYLVEHEYLNNRGYIYTSLYPSIRGRIQYLNGLVLGVSGGSFRRPFSSQIVFEYLGAEIDLRKAISDCGCYPINHGPISEAVKSRLLVPVSSGDFNMTPPVF